MKRLILRIATSIISGICLYYIAKSGRAVEAGILVIAILIYALSYEEK